MIVFGNDQVVDVVECLCVISEVNGKIGEVVNQKCFGDIRIGLPLVIETSPREGYSVLTEIE